MRPPSASGARFLWLVSEYGATSPCRCNAETRMWKCRIRSIRPLAGAARLIAISLEASCLPVALRSRLGWARRLSRTDPHLPRPLGWHLCKTDCAPNMAADAGLDPICDGHRGDWRGERRQSHTLPRARITVATCGRTSPDTLPDAPRLRFSLARGRERRTWR